MSNFLPSDNTLHRRRAASEREPLESAAAGKSTVFGTAGDPSIDSSSASEAEMIDAEQECPPTGEWDGVKFRAVNKRPSSGGWSLVSSYASVGSYFASSQMFPPQNLSGNSDLRPSFSRLRTYRASSSGPSLLSSTLKRAQQDASTQVHEPSSDSVAASSTDEFSDLGGALDTEDEFLQSGRSASASSPFIPNRSTPRGSVIRSRTKSPGGNASPSTTHLTSTLVRRRRGYRPVQDPTHSAPTRRSRRSSLESEEDDAKIGTTFRQLFDATRDIINLSRVDLSPPGQAQPNTILPSIIDAIPHVQAIRTDFHGQAITQESGEAVEDSSEFSGVGEADLPTSFAGSGTSSEEALQLPPKGTRDAGSFPNEVQRSGLFGWLTSVFSIKIWHAVVACSLMFGLGLGVA